MALSLVEFFSSFIGKIGKHGLPIYVSASGQRKLVSPFTKYATGIVTNGYNINMKNTIVPNYA